MYEAQNHDGGDYYQPKRKSRLLARSVVLSVIVAGKLEKVELVVFVFFVLFFVVVLFAHIL